MCLHNTHDSSVQKVLTLVLRIHSLFALNVCSKRGEVLEKLFREGTLSYVLNNLGGL
jgi:hypothetical protein